MKRTDPSWEIKRAKNLITAYFSDNQLDLQENSSFNIAKNVDFFILGSDIFISKKKSFESVLSYKQAHVDDFVALQAEDEFKDIFEKLDALLEYVGSNKIQLRRASAIRQKGHYKDEGFMANLRANFQQFGLNLDFDDDGKIRPTAESCRDIFQALLDHRLRSGFSNNVYDVQDTSNVALGH